MSELNPPTRFAAAMRPPPLCRLRGFTLAELAVVLIILALLSGSMLVPLASRIEARDRQATLDRLRDIQQALTGFAIIHGRLPCPSIEADPAHPDYGQETPPPCNTAVEGLLPWRTLGMPATDPWGSTRASADAPWQGHWRYRVDRSFADQPITAASVPASNLQIHAHDGRRITVSDSQAVAIVFSTGANRRADGLNATYSATGPAYQAGEPTADFDDILIWIGRPLLIARLAQAGRL
ncbi:type II secretion system protein [Thauera butanivorans]|uniref:type II secretion system protein n=1 Tax=Thauera butanivorans TaxID=86174 RepID=UPI003AB13E65